MAWTKRGVRDFSIIRGETEAYLLGLWAADGSIYTRKGELIGITLSLAEQDKGFLESIANLMCNYPKKLVCNRRRHKNPKWQDMYTLRICSPIIGRQFIQHGIIPNKALVLKPPITIPKPLIHHWVRGYFDGDGSIGFYGKSKSLRVTVTGNKTVVEFIDQQLKDFYEHTLHKPFRSHRSRSISWGNMAGEAFVKWIYGEATIYMPRKYDKAKLYITEEWLHTPVPPTWSKADDRLLLQVYDSSSKEKLLELFPLRSVHAIEDRAYRLRVKHGLVSPRLTYKVDNIKTYIKKYRPKGLIYREIALIIGCSESVVCKAAKEMREEMTEKELIQYCV